jgi:hypothetical protein
MEDCGSPILCAKIRVQRQQRLNPPEKISLVEEFLVRLSFAT